MKNGAKKEKEDSSADKKIAFKEGGEDNTSKLNSFSERQKEIGGKKIINQDKSITNVDGQDETAEDSERNLATISPLVEKEKGPSRDDGSPEINTPVYEPEETEKTAPKMNDN